jgi:hypothetical protein
VERICTYYATTAVAARGAGEKRPDMGPPAKTPQWMLQKPEHIAVGSHCRDHGYSSVGIAAFAFSFRCSIENTAFLLQRSIIKSIPPCDFICLHVAAFVSTSDYEQMHDFVYAHAYLRRKTC